LATIIDRNLTAKTDCKKH